MSIFDKRVAFKPFEYPAVISYKDAINHSYWLVSEWNFIADIHDFHTKLSEIEKNAIKNALLAISQIEVSVKRFWTKLGDRFPKSEFEQVGVTFGECHIDGTEILTPTGWTDLKDIKVGDEVVQFNTNNTFNITKVKYKTDQQYDGEMYRFYNNNTETIVTPNHRMLYYDKGISKEVFANLLVKNTELKIPQAGKLIGGSEEKLTFIDRLCIAIQADGNRRFYNSGYGKKPRKGNGFGAEYEIRIKKQRKIDRLDWILENTIGIEFSKSPIPSRPEMFCYTIRIDDKYDYKSFDWVNLTNKNHLWCLDFVEELAEWDGSRIPLKKDCKVRYSSTNKKAADVAQMVGVGAGYRTNLMVRKDVRKGTYNDVFIISFTNNRERVSLNLHSETKDYSGMVRCVTVDSGAIITRLNGKTFIAGNSEVRHADAYSHLLQVLGLNDDFNQLLQNPVIQGRVEYLTKYLKGASDNSDENFTLTLTLFSIFIENVSLFSQFIIIKSFNKYMNVLKDIDNVVQATQQEECYSEDTDILTPSGWVALSEIKEGDDVYQYCEGKINPTQVLHKTAKKYDGKMLEIGNNSSNCLVTPNHDMVYLNEKDEIKKCKAIDIKYHSKIRIPAGGILANNCENSGLTWEERLRIAIQADGSNLYWTNKAGVKQSRGKEGGFTHQLGLTKVRKQNRLRMILVNSGIEFTEYQADKEIIFKIRYNHDHNYKKMDWFDFSDKSYQWCKEFVEETIEWDGYRSEANTGFSTTDKKIADKVHAAAVLAGYRTNILRHVDSRGYKDCFKVTLSNRSLTPAGHSYEKIETEYSGNVYCVTVPSGVIITRRKDKVCVAGNCIHAMLGVYLIEQIKLEFPSWFNETFYSKLYRACKKAYEAECNIIDWIFEKGELSFLAKDTVKEFIKQRFNDSLELIGGNKVFEVDVTKLEQVRWFNDEIYAEVNTDFFHKKPTTYSKKMQAITAEDIF